MKVFDKLFIATAISILGLCWATPEPARAWSHGISINANLDPDACGVSTNNWCVQANGWTKFTPKTTGDALNCTNGTVKTCIVAVTNTVAASFTSHSTTTTLVIDSGTPPAVGQTVIRTSGVVLGTITGGSNPNFTGTFTGTVPTEAMTSSVGNDTTCALQAVPGGLTSSEDLSAFVPTVPCFTLPIAKGKVRSGKPDWMVLKKGDSWDGGINGPLNGNFGGTGGTSNADLLLITAYGVGARPMLRKVAAATDGLILFNSAAGGYTAVTGLKLYDAVSDPTNATYFNGYTVTGDTTAGSNVITNVSPAVSAAIIASPGSYVLFGTRIPSTPACPGGTCGTLAGAIISSATSSTITLTSGKNAQLNSTGATFQISGTEVQGSIGWGAVLNTAIVEDMELYFSNLQLPYNAVSVTAGLNVRIRRNMISYSWNRPFGGTNIFSGPTPNIGSYLLEENVVEYGGLYPDLWYGSEYGQAHCLYMHDPGTPFTIRRNIVADCSGTGAQNRDAGPASNNTWIRSPTLQFANTLSGNTSVSYDVYDSAGEFNNGNRTAKTTISCVATNPPAAPCATSISFEGITGYVGSGSAGMQNSGLINLDNPGSIIGRTLYENVTAYDTITLSTDGSGTTAGIYSGIRGDGIRAGDRLRSVLSQGIGLTHSRTGQYYSPGVATGGTYAGPSNVTVSNGTPILVTETSAAFTRPIDEQVRFTSGTLPTPLVVGTTYCTVAQGFTYNLYPATAGPVINGATSFNCPGVAGNTIDATGGSTATNVPRIGSSKFFFNSATIPYTTAVPTWLTQGMSMIMVNAGLPFAGGNTWVASVAADRQSYTTTDASLFGFVAFQLGMMFDAPNTANQPTVRLGPNNVFTRAMQRTPGGSQIALQLGTYDFAVNASSNYIYNVNSLAANNTQDLSASWPSSATGNGLSPAAFAASNTISVLSQVLNLANSTTYPNASVPAYDASVGGRTITGTLAANGFGGSTLTVSAGTPVLGDFLFDNSGSNPITQYSEIVYQLSGTTWLVNNNTQTIGTPFSIKLGSYEHFMENALGQSKEAGWNTTYTANAANNFIRNAIGCTAASTPTCPAQ